VKFSIAIIAVQQISVESTIDKINRIEIDKTSNNIHEYDASIFTNLAQIDLLMDRVYEKEIA